MSEQMQLFEDIILAMDESTEQRREERQEKSINDRDLQAAGKHI